VLINDSRDATYPVAAGKTYLFRILNIGAFPSFFFNIAGHSFQIVEMDGVYTTPTNASTLYIGAAQRYTILVTAKTGATSNFDISALVDTSMFRAPFTSNPVAHGVIQYDASLQNPIPRTPRDLMPAILPPANDASIPALDKQPLLDPVTKQIVLNFNFSDVNGIPRYIYSLANWVVTPD
jgi:iron transport multicopper oxidase